jgi:hypothetical protein
MRITVGRLRRTTAAGADGGGADGGKVGVGAGAADTVDFAALGQASTTVSETAADAIIMIAPSPMRRTFMSQIVRSVQRAGSRFPSRHHRLPRRNRYKENACETLCAEMHSACRRSRSPRVFQVPRPAMPGRGDQIHPHGVPSTATIR